MATLILLNKAQMGHGDIALGARVLRNFLQKSVAITDLEAIAFYNEGVRLAARDSAVATELTLLHDRGIDLMPCVTCVDHYGLRGRLCTERLSSMEEIIDAMRKANKVITL